MDHGEFHGVIGRYHWESTPWWPQVERAPKDAPNVLIVVLDDAGFAQLGCFGSDIDTPSLDRLAANGLRYSNFHTTALCSPTRACLLTGRNHHSNGMGRIAELATGFPGYNARIPRANGFLSEMLMPHGYAACGRRQVAPDARGRVTISLRLGDRWPLGRGFERFYGFFEGETHQFAPDARVTTTTSRAAAHASTRGTTSPRISPTRRSGSYRSARTSIRRSRSSATSRPARATRRTKRPRNGSSGTAATSTRDGTPGARRHFAPPKGKRRDATRCTELSPRPDWVPAWDSLGDDARRVYAALHGGVRRLPLTYRPPDRPLPRLARGARRARQHDRDGAVRQRRELRGWPHG